MKPWSPPLGLFAQHLWAHSQGFYFYGVLKFSVFFTVNPFLSHGGWLLAVFYLQFSALYDAKCKWNIKVIEGITVCRLFEYSYAISYKSLLLLSGSRIQITCYVISYSCSFNWIYVWKRKITFAYKKYRCSLICIGFIFAKTFFYFIIHFLHFKNCIQQFCLINILLCYLYYT